MSVVPSASRPRSFRYRSGERCDNPAGLFKIGKLESNCGADNNFLPVIGDRESPNPCPPIIAGTISKLAAGGGDVGGQRIIGPQHHVNWLCQNESGFPLDE